LHLPELVGPPSVAVNHFDDFPTVLCESPPE
jgi:hypothetical protein